MLDKIQHLINGGGPMPYLILFLIIFAETGLVVMPILPGDSLLFVAGSLATPGGNFQPVPLALILICAALLGDNLNYWIGRRLGERALAGKLRFMKREHLDKTQKFFDKHGTKTVVLARFTPIVRTFTPFVAGVGAMPYARFLTYSVAGAVLWVSICVGAGYRFGTDPWVRKHFEVIVIAVVVISLLPIVIERLIAKRRGDH